MLFYGHARNPQESTPVHAFTLTGKVFPVFYHTKRSLKDHHSGNETTLATLKRAGSQLARPRRAQTGPHLAL
jgi:hypothetical protein